MAQPEAPLQQEEFIDVGPLVSNLTGLVVALYREAGIEPPCPFLFTEAELARLVAAIRRA